MNKETADLYCDIEEYEKAYEIYTKVLEENPDNYNVMSNRIVAILCLAEKKPSLYKTAIVDAKKCVSMNPNSAKMWGRLAACLYGMKEYDKSIVAYNKAKELCTSEKSIENKEKYNVMIQMLDIKTQSFDSNFANFDIFNIMNTSIIKDALNNQNFKDKIMKMKDNPFMALQDKDIFSVIESIAKSIKNS